MEDKKFRVIICGTRTFNDYDLLESKVNQILKFIPDEVEVISGCAPGADTLGERYAKDHGFDVLPFPADWENHGPAAGPTRNSQMLGIADAVIAFWDGKSKGTLDTINKAKAKGLKLRIINI